MYRIGEFSKLCKVTIKALRYYDEMGLLKPAEVDQFTGYRLYTTDQLMPLQRIVALRQAGLTIEETTAVLSGQNSGEILLGRKRQLHGELDEAQRRLFRLESILNQEDIFMEYQAVVRTIPKCTVYCKEGVIPTYEDLHTFIPQIHAECMAANPSLKHAEPNYCFVCYLDHEYKDSNIRLLYAQAVTAAGKDTENVKFREFDGIEAVCVYHKGSYETLGEAYAFAISWLERNGYQMVDAPRERYIDGHWNKSDPADYLCELQFPVKKV